MINRQNKVGILVLIIGILLMMGCGQNEKENETSGQESNITQEPTSVPNEDNDTDKIRIGFAQVGHESDWRKAATECAMETFSEENGYELNC